MSRICNAHREFQRKCLGEAPVGQLRRRLLLDSRPGMDGLFHVLPCRFLYVLGSTRRHDASCVERARVRLYCLDFLRDLAAEGGSDIVRGVRAKVEELLTAEL